MTEVPVHLRAVSAPCKYMRVVRVSV